MRQRRAVSGGQRCAKQDNKNEGRKQPLLMPLEHDPITTKNVDKPGEPKPCQP
jgi:hypothetical protein